MLLKLIFFFPSNQESSCSSMWNTPSGYLVGMKCSHTVHPFPYGLLLFLTQGIGPLQSFHFSITWQDYHPLERITTSLSHYPGGLSPPREDYHFSLATLGGCHPLISLNITLGGNQPGNKVTCRPLLEYFIPYPFSAQLFWFSCWL